MSTSCLALGAVFNADWCPDPIRIVAFDHNVVMYDVWWPHKGSWAMAKLLGTHSYYRLTREHFEAHATYVRTDPLSERELSVHRPDLPFSFAQRVNLSWYDDWPRQPDEPLNGLVLHASSVYLWPFGPRDSAKPGVLVVASNGQFFTEPELLRAAKSIQKPHLRETRLSEGVGLYRSGYQKRLPSYYIWGAQSRLQAKAHNAA